MAARPYAPFLGLRSTPPPPLVEAIAPMPHTTRSKPYDHEIDRPRDWMRTAPILQRPGLYGPGNTHNLGSATRAHGAADDLSTSYRVHSTRDLLDHVQSPLRGPDRPFVLPGLRQLIGGGVLEPSISNGVGLLHKRPALLNRTVDPNALWPTRTHTRDTEREFDACSASSHKQQVPPRSHLVHSLTLEQRVSDADRARPSSLAVDKIHRRSFASAGAPGYPSYDDKLTATRPPQAPLASVELPNAISTSTAAKACSSSEGAPSKHAVAAPVAKTKKKRKVRICTTAGCDKLVVDRGVCIRHGGGKRCSVEGCDCRAQNKGLCWKHGGYTICQVDDCGKRAKSRGMCWSHGGGTQCITDTCGKVAVSRGHCWAHGGGKRCKIPSCQKPAALRMDDYCAEHYMIISLKQNDAVRRASNE